MCPRYGNGGSKGAGDMSFTMVVSADMISEVRIQFVYYQTNH